MLPILNFPEFGFRFKNSENKLFIFDEIRKKFVVLQPEEWVRQHCVRFLTEVKGYPKSLINVEKKLTLNGLAKRYDIVVFKPDGSSRILIECKAPKVTINQSVFDQLAQYNLKMNADLMMLTNGHDHYFCQLDYQAGRYVFLRDLPDYRKD